MAPYTIFQLEEKGKRRILMPEVLQESSCLITVTQTGWNEMKPKFLCFSTELPPTRLRTVGEPQWDKFPSRGHLNIDNTTNILKSAPCVPCSVGCLHWWPTTAVKFSCHFYNVLWPLCNTTKDMKNALLGNLICQLSTIDILGRARFL